METIFNTLVNYAIRKKCSDIHIDYAYENCIISMRLYGKIIKISEFKNDKAIKLLNYILFRANIDIINKHALNTGLIKYPYKKREIFLRISVVFTQHSQSIVIRILNNHQQVLLKNLSLINNNYDVLRKIISYKSGLVILTGKTGSGKTTTLYALLDEIKRVSTKKIITLEDPIERNIEGILQVSINTEIMTYFDVLKQVLRHDPDIIVIGEIRDENDLKLAVQAALSGHLVLTSMHAINAAFAINRLQELKINNSDLKACLQLISYQELFYTKNFVAFCIYEFINNQQINKYLNNESFNYYKIIDYKKALEKEIQYYESK